MVGQTLRLTPLTVVAEEEEDLDGEMAALTAMGEMEGCMVVVVVVAIIP